MNAYTTITLYFRHTAFFFLVVAGIALSTHVSAENVVLKKTSLGFELLYPNELFVETPHSISGVVLEAKAEAQSPYLSVTVEYVQGTPPNKKDLNIFGKDRLKGYLAQGKRDAKILSIGGLRSQYSTDFLPILNVLYMAESQGAQPRALVQEAVFIFPITGGYYLVTFAELEKRFAEREQVRDTIFGSFRSIGAPSQALRSAASAKAGHVASSDGEDDMFWTKLLFAVSLVAGISLALRVTTRG